MLLKARDQVSHPYRTIGKIIVLYTQPLTEMSTRSIKIMFLGSKAVAGA
jgi:hypothetical protein